VVISTNIVIRTTSLCLNTRLSFKEKFPNFLHFCWILNKRFNFYVFIPNDEYNIPYSRTLPSRKRQLYNWFLSFRFCSFFAFWRDEKQTFNIVPFHSTSYVLNSFGFLENSNLVSECNKGKILIFVRSIYEICQLEIPELIHIFMFQSSFWISVSYIGSFNLIV
jgi:hypothetical protein